MTGARMPTKAELKRNLRVLKARLKDRPMDLDARIRIARTFRLLSRATDALDHYAAVARYLSLAGRPLQAIAVLKELLQVAPTHEESLLFLAKLYARTRPQDVEASGRVAVPLEERVPEPRLDAFSEELTRTPTGIWRAIAPPSLDDGALETNDHTTLDAPAVPSDALSVDDADVLEERAADAPEENRAPSATPAERPAPTTSSASDDAHDPLARVPWFSTLPPTAFVRMSHATVFQRCGPGEQVFVENEPGDSCIVIARGHARVSASTAAGEAELLQLGEGDIAGIFSLLASPVRTATLTAIDQLEYFEVDRVAIEELLANYPELKQGLLEIARERALLLLLARLPVWSALPPLARLGAAQRFRSRTYAAGDDLFLQGDETDGMWLVLEGDVVVEQEAEGGNEPAALSKILGPGAFVGTFARLSEIASDRAALTQHGVRTAHLGHRAFHELLALHPALRELPAAFQREGLMWGRSVFGAASASTSPPTRLA